MFCVYGAELRNYPIRPNLALESFVNRLYTSEMTHGGLLLVSCRKSRPRADETTIRKTTTRKTTTIEDHDHRRPRVTGGYRKGAGFICANVEQRKGNSLGAGSCAQFQQCKRGRPAWYFLPAHTQGIFYSACKER